jgi:hypothetical protein
VEGPVLAFAFKMPTTITYGRHRPKGGGVASIVGVPIAPRPREAGATWSPQRFLAGMPALVDEHDLDAWLRWAPAGEKVAYYLGPSLGADRLENEALDLVARAVLARAETDTIGSTAPPCGHIRGWWRGSRDLEPVQRRMPDGEWLYFVVRR